MSTDDPECVVNWVVINVDLGDGLRCATGHPAFVAFIVNHHRCTRRHDRVLTGNNTHDSHESIQSDNIQTMAEKELRKQKAD